MDENGIFLCGRFTGSDVRVREDKTHYYYAVAVGADSYKVRSDHDYRANLNFGDVVAFNVGITAFKDKFYMTGELYDIKE